MAVGANTTFSKTQLYLGAPNLKGVRYKLHLLRKKQDQTLRFLLLPLQLHLCLTSHYVRCEAGEWDLDKMAPEA